MKATELFKGIVKKILRIPSEKNSRPIYFKCPYMKSECAEYDSGSATLLTDCKDCANYNKGIVASKF